jgi:phage-related holin
MRWIAKVVTYRVSKILSVVVSSATFHNDIIYYFMMNETVAITATASQIISTPHCW